MNRPIGSLTADADDLTGTENDDTFDASLGSKDFVVGNTLSSADSIDGGAGNDTLDAVLSTEVNPAGEALNVQPTTRDVENINIEARSSNGDVVLDAKDMVGVNTFGSDYSDGDLVIQNVNTLDNDGNLRNTSDITVRMDHTDNFNSDGDASDLTVYFDDDYLRSGEETKDSLQLRIVNNFELAENDSPLTDFESVDFTVGGESVSVDITGAETYQDVADAINGELAVQGFESVTASVADARTSIFSDDLGGYEQGDLAGEYLPIDIVSTGGDLEPGTIKRASDVADFDGLNTWESRDSVTTNDPISVNVELEKVGRAGEGGNLTIGGKSQQVVDGQENGIEVFDIDVLGDSSKPSNLGFIKSTNDTLETVNIATGAEFAGSGDVAGLTVRGEQFFKTNEDGNFVDEDGAETTKPAEYVVDETSNPFGAATTVNASGFEGDLTIGTDYDAQNIQLTANGGGDVEFHGTDSQDILTGAGTDTLDLTNQSGDVTTGGGSDEVTVDGFSNPAGELNTIDTGAGNDVITVNGAGDSVVINAGSGNDVINGNEVSVDVVGSAGNNAIYVDNTGSKASATIDTSSLKQNDAQGNASYGFLYGRTVTVTVDGSKGVNSAVADALEQGFEAKATVEAGNVEGATRLTNQADLNAAVIEAVNGDETLSDLVSVVENNAGELQFTSKIDGDAVSIDIDLGESDWTENDVKTLEAEYQAANGNSDLTVKDDYGTATVQDEMLAGSNSTAANSNTVSLGNGEDTVVLSTSAKSNDTIVFDGNFGTTSIVNFDAETDGLNFDAVLTSKKSASGSEVSEERIATTYSTGTTLAANAVNVQSYTGDDDLSFDDLSFDDLSAADLTDVFPNLSTKSYADDGKELVGNNGTAIVMVQNGDNDGEYKVFQVNFDGTTEDGELSNSSISEMGTVDFGADADDAIDQAITNFNEDFVASAGTVDFTVGSDRAFNAATDTDVNSNGDVTGEVDTGVTYTLTQAELADIDTLQGDGDVTVTDVDGTDDAFAALANVNGTVTAQVGAAAADFTDGADELENVDTLDLSAENSDITVSADQLGKVENADTNDSITVNGLNGKSVTATAASDTFDFAGTETGVEITDFGVSGTDAIDLADVNAASSVNVDMANSFVVIADDNSSAIYAVSNANADGDDIVAGDLELVGTVDEALTTGDITIA